jgi:MOSC domain-containing protein YiiM
VVEGRVERLGAKPKVAGEHGLPKPELSEAHLTAEGMAGDFNLYRTVEKHGDPAMALLLLPAETIEALRAEGWPVQPGDLGENITTRGIAYDELTPPARLRLGDAVVETTSACTPCDNLYLLPYVGQARGPEFLKATVDRRGWYARVVVPGRVHRGDRITNAP